MAKTSELVEGDLVRPTIGYINELYDDFKFMRGHVFRVIRVSRSGLSCNLETITNIDKAKSLTLAFTQYSFSTKGFEKL